MVLPGALLNPKLAYTLCGYGDFLCSLKKLLVLKVIENGGDKK